MWILAGGFGCAVKKRVGLVLALIHTGAVVLHFIDEHGARRIAFLRGPEHHASAQDRLRGYRDALMAAGLNYDRQLVSGTFDWGNGNGAVSQLVESRGLVPGRDFDALIGSSDMMTVPAIQYLHERGFTMPEDYRVGGFNNSAESEILPHPLSTVRMPYRELAEESLRVLNDLMNGRGGGERVLPCEVVIRARGYAGTARAATPVRRAGLRRYRARGNAGTARVATPVRRAGLRRYGVRGRQFAATSPFYNRRNFALPTNPTNVHLYFFEAVHYTEIKIPFGEYP
jgi:hypothetical protein